MNRTIALILAGLIVLSVFSGCAAAEKQAEEAPENTVPENKPPVMTLYRKDEPDKSFDVSPSGYSWYWKNADGTDSGVEADAIHPLDRNVLKSAARTEDPFDVTWCIRFEKTPSTLSFDRWDYADIGNTESPVRESESLRAPYALNVKKSSVYVFHVRFPDAENGSGMADYYLVTGPDAVIPEAKPVMNAAEFMMSEEYGKWWTEYRQATSDSREVQDGMDDYYADILPLLLGEGKDNAVCSPLNMYLALSMLAQTTGGETRQQILDALRSADMDALTRRFSALAKATTWDNPLFKCLPAGSLWLDAGFPLREETVEVLAGDFGSDVFTGQPGSEEFDRQLRDWTNEHTGGLLQEYVAGMHMDPSAVLELVSTLYFKSAWATPFSPKDTAEETFHRVDGDTVCQMMHRSDTGTYYYGDGFGAVELGLSESGSMFFILPDENVPAEQLLQDPAVLALIRGNRDAAESKYLIVNMGVPRFSVKAKTDLRDTLSALGISRVFDAEKADFTPLTTETGVFLSRAEHAAAVSIDEEGVTGAAYTDLMLCGGAMLPEESVDFTLDRPFLFAVTARDGSILFAGIVRDPAVTGIIRDPLE